MHLWYSSYRCLKFVKLSESQKSSFSIFPVLKGVNKIKKIQKSFKTFPVAYHLSSMARTTGTFTKFGQVILDILQTLGQSNLSVRPLCLLSASHNCLFNYFSQISLTLNDFAGCRPVTLIKETPSIFLRILRNF